MARVFYYYIVSHPLLLVYAEDVLSSTIDIHLSNVDGTFSLNLEDWVCGSQTLQTNLGYCKTLMYVQYSPSIRNEALPDIKKFKRRSVVCIGQHIVWAKYIN